MGKRSRCHSEPQETRHTSRRGKSDWRSRSPYHSFGMCRTTQGLREVDSPSSGRQIRKTWIYRFDLSYTGRSYSKKRTEASPKEALVHTTFTELIVRCRDGGCLGGLVQLLAEASLSYIELLSVTKYQCLSRTNLMSRFLNLLALKSLNFTYFLDTFFCISKLPLRQRFSPYFCVY